MMSRETRLFCRFLARQYGMSMDDFVKATGVSRNTVRKILNGEVTPNISTRQKLLRVITIGQLQRMIGGVGDNAEF